MGRTGPLGDGISHSGGPGSLLLYKQGIDSKTRRPPSIATLALRTRKRKSKTGLAHLAPAAVDSEQPQAPGLLHLSGSCICFCLSLRVGHCSILCTPFSQGASCLLRTPKFRPSWFCRVLWGHKSYLVPEGLQIKHWLTSSCSAFLSPTFTFATYCPMENSFTR